MEKRKLSLVALLAAVYAVVSILPGFPIIGISGSEIDLARALEPAYGIVMGPLLGPSSAFLGAIIGKFVSGETVGLIFTPLALVSSFMAASLYQRRLLGFPGWTIATAMLSALILGWYISPIGREVVYYPVPHFAGLFIILLLGGKLSEFLHSKSKKELTAGLLLCSYPSTIAAQMLGNLIFIAIFQPSPAFFVALLPVTIAERIIITVLSTVIGVPMILSLRAISIHENVNAVRSPTDSTLLDSSTARNR